MNTALSTKDEWTGELKLDPGQPGATPSASGASLATWLEIYRTMLLARRIDRLEAELVARGESFFHVSGAGHEGSAVLNWLLTPTDYLHLHYRDKALMLARGVAPVQFFHSLRCNSQSHSLGRQMSAHMSDPRLRILSIVGPVGNNALQAAGVAAVIKEKSPGSFILCSMGDGSAQQGEVLEAIAEAVRAQLPVLFFIQDNRYAISTRTRGQTFYSRPDGEAQEFYGLPIHRIAGHDPVAAMEGLAPVIESVRQGQPELVVFHVERLCDHTSSDDERKYRSKEEIQSAAQTNDPIENLRRVLAAQGIANEHFEALGAEVEAIVKAAVECALEVRSAPAAKNAKKALPDKLQRLADTTTEANHAERSPESGPARNNSLPIPSSGLTMLDAIREVLKYRLASDSRVTLIGEDIEDPKGDVFGVTRGLSTAFPGRVSNSALTESTIVGTSIGRSLAGDRPVAFIQFADFLPLAFNQIFSELSTMYWRTAGAWDCPVIIMAPCGGYRPGLGPFHGQTMESLLAHSPGLDVFMPSNAVDAAGLLNAAFESERPTVFLYPKICLNDREHLAPVEATRNCLPIGKARLLSCGSDLTLVTWGAAVRVCLKAARALEAADIKVDLLDLRSVSPWDREAVCASAAKTGALVVVHEDNLTAGFGAEVVAAVCEAVPRPLIVRRLTRPDTYIPCRFVNQLEILPSFKGVIASISEALGLELGWGVTPSENDSPDLVKAMGPSPADRMIEIISWKVKSGDIVAAGDPIAEIESDKSVSDLASPSAGMIKEILVAPGKSVPVGTPILRLNSSVTEERVSDTQIFQRCVPQFGRKSQVRRKDAAWLNRTFPARSQVGLSNVYTAEGSVTISNEALAARFAGHTAMEIYRLTGIESRRHLPSHETALDMAAAAAIKALAGEGLEVGDLDAIFCSTSTPVEVTPSMACGVHAKLCARGVQNSLAAYDILAACSGFIYAASAAYDFLQTRPGAKVMVITAEALSKVVDPEDFDTAILFGDAATAIVLYGANAVHRSKALLHRPVIGGHADPEKILCVSGLGSGSIHMEGRRVFREAVQSMITALQEVCRDSGLKVADLNLIIPHQANGRIIETVRSRLGAVGDRVVNNVRHRGNTSSCTIPLCLAELQGRFKSGDRIGLCAFGGGFTAGAAVLEAR